VSFNPVKGLDSVIKAIKEQTEKTEGALGAALYMEGLDLDAKAVKLMPVDTGRMRATHYVTQPQKTPGGPVVEIGVGTDYAVYVHERTDLAHEVGQAKFYEQPLNESRSGYAERIRARTVDNMAKDVSSVPVTAPTTPKG